jgi:hypothetical protein
MKFSTPYLIQRGSFKDTKEEDIVGLDSLISYDYMGSSEFEFGALSASLKRMTATWAEYEWFPLDEIQDADGQVLYVLCRTSQKEDVIKAVKTYAQEEPHTLKERVGLHSYIVCQSEFDMRINFWWDVTSEDNWDNNEPNGNDWMACFGNDIRRLIKAINAVCVKHERTFSPMTLPAKTDRPVRSSLEVSSTINGVEILYPDGRKTVINKRKIIEVDDTYNDVVKVKVKTKAGAEKWLEIQVGPSSARALILNHVKEWPTINKGKI